VNLVRKRLTYANVMSSLAVFLVLGGATAFAAGQLGKNTVGSKQLKNNAVTAAKVKKEAIVGAKIKKGAITGIKVTNDSLTGTQINESTLSTVPSANSANSANVASSLTPAEAVHVVGAPGQPPFEGGSSNYAEGGLHFAPVGFWKDHEGVVHLQGIARVGKSGGGTVTPVFTLPPGFRPEAGALALFEMIKEASVIIGGSSTFIEGIELSGKVVGGEEKPAALEGITFRPGS
jgi:hypothetical protein